MEMATAQADERAHGQALRSEIGQSFYLLGLMAGVLGGSLGLALLAVRLLG
jgi:hypothetical protein